MDHRYDITTRNFNGDIIVARMAISFMKNIKA
jgi:hypothetical protein